jgi:TonB-linked SusC/RagA family outer membrane protein
MRMGRSRRARSALVALALLAGMPAAALAQGATLSGRVTEQETGQPIEAAQVHIVGTAMRQLTSAEGRFIFRDLRPGTIQVRVLRVPFEAQTRSVTVVAGQETTLDFALGRAVAKLEQMVTTATGEQRSVEVGNTIARIDAAETVETQPVANIGDLLRARAPGVQVITGAATGTGARVRIRGTSSLSLSNDPIYVIDGIRMESSTNATSISVGGSSPSRVNDLNPEEIESVEVIKGPAAAALYGTQAANGVIIITTKRGQVGRPQWATYVEQGLVTMPTSLFPDNYSTWFTPSTSTVSRPGCFLSRQSASSTSPCTVDSLTRFSPLKNDETTIFEAGHRQQYGLQVSGGVEAVRYFVSGEYESETGPYEMPEFAQEDLREQNIEIRDEWLNPNRLARASGRANLNLTFGPTATLGIFTNYLSSEFRQPQADNNITGWGYNALAARGTRTAGTIEGYTAYSPGDIFQETTTQYIDRFIGSASPTWNPVSWLQTRGNLGVDYTSRVDTDLCRFAECANFSTYREGFKEDNRTQFVQYTLDGSGTASFQVTPDFTSKTTVGVQYFQNLFDRNGAYGESLPPGSSRVTTGAIQTADEATDETRTLGAFVEEAVSFRDRVFVNAAIRADDNSAFGQNFSAVYYPSASISWLISEEAFFPQAAALSSLRLRASYGASGVQPETTDALAFFTGTSVAISGEDQPAVYFDALGNADLKPERSTEFEAGFDISLLDNRADFEFTYYNKVSKDALIQRVIPPSVGTDATVRFENLGEIQNSGIEGLLTLSLLTEGPVGWSATLAGSRNTNELIELGEGISPIITATTRQIEGYPLNGYWALPYTFDDANDDGIVTANEVTVATEFAFIGYSQPRTEISWSNDLTFFDGTVRLNTLFDYKGGHRLYNNSERFRCQSGQNCAGMNDPNAALWEQARVVALREKPGATQAGFMEKADFIKFREVSLTAQAPERWAAAARASSLSLTVAMRNVATWTDYSGFDPENTYGQNDVPTDLLTLPQTRLLTARLNVGF